MGVGKIDTNGHWAVDGHSIYIPSDVEINHENVVSSDSGRTESGDMHITWLKRDVRKVNLTYNFLTAREVEFMVDLMQGKELSFTYYDNGVKTISHAYVGKCTYKEKTLALYQEDGGLCSDFKINVIEM